MNLRALQGTFIIAACIYIFDALMMGQGVIAVVAFLIALVVGVVKILIAAHKKDRAQMLLRAVRIGVYLVMVAGVLATIYINNRLAARHAEAIIAACRQYEARNGHLPDRLQELVPEFLPGIPPAKYTLAFGDFVYWSSKDSHRLSYVVFPPFLLAVYSFEGRHWIARD